MVTEDDMLHTHEVKNFGEKIQFVTALDLKKNALIDQISYIAPLMRTFIRGTI